MVQGPDEISPSGFALAAHRRWPSIAGAVVLHVLVFWGLAASILFKTPDATEDLSVPRIVALAPREAPPPPDVEKFGPADVVTTLPRFRPRLGVPSRQRREGDPALAVWKYLCNRDSSVGEAVQRDCPEFHFGDVMLGTRDPLNRSGDIGALLGADTATMSLDEAGKAKGWIRPKIPWPADGGRAQADSLGLPGHDPFAILPGHNRIK